MLTIISIHALRGEGDADITLETSTIPVISIHALRGEGDCFYKLVGAVDAYISIHALRGEGDLAALPWYERREVEISIHALRGEGDDMVAGKHGGTLDFNPRPPWGGRPLTAH